MGVLDKIFFLLCSLGDSFCSFFPESAKVLGSPACRSELYSKQQNLPYFHLRMQCERGLSIVSAVWLQFRNLEESRDAGIVEHRGRLPPRFCSDDEKVPTFFGNYHVGVMTRGRGLD